MKLLIILTFVALAVARPGDFYDNKYDDFDVESVTNNERLLKAYAHCFLGDGKCTAEGNEFKQWMPEAITSSCGKCTEKQKKLIAKTIVALKGKLPDEYTALINKNDPGATHSVELQAFLDKYLA